MKKKFSRNPDRPVGELTPIVDFLPPPDKLIPREKTRKITIAVDDETLRFFKSAATEKGFKYQRMMREVLKGYARRYG